MFIYSIVLKRPYKGATPQYIYVGAKTSQEALEYALTKWGVPDMSIVDTKEFNAPLEVNRISYLYDEHYGNSRFYREIP